MKTITSLWFRDMGRHTWNKEAMQMRRTGCVQIYNIKHKNMQGYAVCHVSLLKHHTQTTSLAYIKSLLHPFLPQTYAVSDPSTQFPFRKRYAFLPYWLTEVNLHISLSNHFIVSSRINHLEMEGWPEGHCITFQWF